jgi:hypothetical protein
MIREILQSVALSLRFYCLERYEQYKCQNSEVYEVAIGLMCRIWKQWMQEFEVE